MHSYTPSTPCRLQPYTPSTNPTCFSDTISKSGILSENACLPVQPVILTVANGAVGRRMSFERASVARAALRWAALRCVALCCVALCCAGPRCAALGCAGVELLFAESVMAEVLSETARGVQTTLERPLPLHRRAPHGPLYSARYSRTSCSKLREAFPSERCFVLRSNRGRSTCVGTPVCRRG